MRHATILLATLLLTTAPTALGARSDIDLDVDADVDMAVSAKAAARGEGRYTYTWDWGDGEATARAGASARHEYRAPGVYRVVVTVTDEAGEEYRRTREVTVRAPATEWEVEQDDERVRAEADVDVRTRVTWDWGDGEVEVGRRASHRYREPGTYEVVATFERGHACWTESRTVVVRDEEGEEEAEEEDEERRSSREARARVSLPGASARVDVGWSRRADAETGASSSYDHDSSVSISSYDRHDAPGAPAPIVLALVGLLAVGARKLLRR